MCEDNLARVKKQGRVRYFCLTYGPFQPAEKVFLSNESKDIILANLIRGAVSLFGLGWGVHLVGKIFAYSSRCYAKL